MQMLIYILSAYGYSKRRIEEISMRVSVNKNGEKIKRQDSLAFIVGNMRQTMKVNEKRTARNLEVS